MAEGKEKFGSKYELVITEMLSDETIKIIEKLTEMYPETIAEFKRLLYKEFVTFCEKQYDYGPGNVSVGTQLKTDKEVMISLKGLWFRMNDKIQRLFNIILVKDSLKTANEPIEDAWEDLAVYSKISRLVKEKKWGK